MRNIYEKPELNVEEFFVEDITNDGSLSANPEDISIDIGDIVNDDDIV